MRVPVVLAAAAILLYASGLLVWIQNSVVVAPQLASYAQVDSRTIVMAVYVAPCSWTRVAHTAESATEVRVTIETLPCLGVGAGSATLGLRELEVALASDLGTRSVEDANGQAIPPR
jgi:hypothetical protein